MELRIQAMLQNFAGIVCRNGRAMRRAFFLLFDRGEPAALAAHMGPRPWVALGLIVCLVAFVLGAAPPPADIPRWIASPSQSVDVKLRDLELTLQSRKVLLQDDGLSALKLGVSVRNGVATIWGFVPSKDLARRAEQQLRQVPGLKSVHNDLHLQRPDGRPTGLALLPLQQRAPFAEPVVPQPSRVEASLAHRPGRQPFDAEMVGIKPGKKNQAASSDEDNRAPQPIPLMQALSLPKQALTDSSESQRVSPQQANGETHDLAARIESLRVCDERCRGIRTQVVGGIVTLRGTVNRWEHLYDLARSVSRFRGVERVILDDVHAESP